MDDNRFTPFIVDDPGPRQKPRRDHHLLMLQITTATCAFFCTLGVLIALDMIDSDWHAASSMRCAGLHEVTR